MDEPHRQRHRNTDGVQEAGNGPLCHLPFQHEGLFHRAKQLRVRQESMARILHIKTTRAANQKTTITCTAGNAGPKKLTDNAQHPKYPQKRWPKQWISASAHAPNNKWDAGGESKKKLRTQERKHDLRGAVQKAN